MAAPPLAGCHCNLCLFTLLHACLLEQITHTASGKSCPQHKPADVLPRAPSAQSALHPAVVPVREVKGTGHAYRQALGKGGADLALEPASGHQRTPEQISFVINWVLVLFKGIIKLEK